MAVDGKKVDAVEEATPVPEQPNLLRPAVPERYADESFKLFHQVHVSDPTPEEALKIRNKCLWRVLPFLCIGYHLMYLDKQTVRCPEYIQPTFA